MDSTFATKNPKTGLVEIVDMVSGKVIAVQREPMSLMRGHQELMVEVTLPTGEKILMQKGIDPGLLAYTQHEPFNQILVDLVCEAVAQGESLTYVCTKPGMPKYTALCRWRRQHPHIDRQLEQARRDRAEYLRDEAVREATQAESTKDPINAAALRVDTYKWAAGVDEAKYSPKAKIEANINVPTQIVVHTGINREPREVKNEHGNTQEQMASALPDSTGRAAGPTGSNNEVEADKVRAVPSTTPEPGDGVAGG